MDGEYIFDKGVEPPYINRNWLLHGKCGREIERFECIQLINALETVEYVLGEKRKKVLLMTNKMEKMRIEIARAIITCFPRKYIEMVFVGGVSEKEFIDEMMVEFIKYAFDNSQEKHPLRYYVPYGVDKNTDARMKYSRVLKYCQKYRDQEYDEFKRRGIKYRKSSKQKA